MKNVKGEASVIGLGAMGSALARALLQNNYPVTVWNRTTAKAELLVKEGAVLATTVADAAAASPVVVICVADYKTAHGLLSTQEASAALRGKLLIQLSTGSPQEARDSEAWARGRGIEYLDGAIMAIPLQIGTPEATIFVSGSEPAFRESEPILKNFAGNLRYVGESVGSAAALDFAALSYGFGGLFGALHGALICESEGLQVGEFGAMLANLAPSFSGMAKHTCESIQTGTFAENPQSTVTTCAGAFELFVRQAGEARINSEFPTFGLGLLKRAVAAGYGDEEFAALIKVLRGEGSHKGGLTARRTQNV